MDVDVSYDYTEYFISKIHYTEGLISLTIVSDDGVRYQQSFDDGKTWVYAQGKVPKGMAEMYAFAPDTAYCTLANRHPDWGQNQYDQLCVTYDGGHTWEFLLDHFVPKQSWGLWDLHIYEDARHILATGDVHMFFSNNGGKSWRREKADLEGGSIGSWTIKRQYSPYSFEMSLDDELFEMVIDSSLIVVSVEEQQRADAFALQVLPNIIERGQAPMLVFPPLTSATPATVTLYDAQGRSYATSSIMLHPQTETRFVITGATAVLPAGQYYVIVEAGNVLFHEGLVVR
jgi:hypothetical protein